MGLLPHKDIVIEEELRACSKGYSTQVRWERRFRMLEKLRE